MIDTKELRFAASKSVRDLALLPSEVLELLDRLEAAESARRDDYQNWMTTLDRNAELLEKLEAAEKELVELRLGVSKQQSLTDAAQQLAEAAQRRADKLGARAEAAEKERDDVAWQLVQSDQGKRKISEECDTYKAAYNEWIAKTEWMQDELTCGKLPAKYLGMHRADGIKAEIDALRASLEAAEKNLGCCQAEREEAAALFLSVKTRLTEERDALRAEVIHWKEQKEPGAAGWRALARILQAKVEAMEKQEPAGTLHDDGCFVWRETAPHQSNYASWKMVLYALPGAKGEEK